jgi:hypothetical protein
MILGVLHDVRAEPVGVGTEFRPCHTPTMVKRVKNICCAVWVSSQVGGD